MAKGRVNPRLEVDDELVSAEKHRLLESFIFATDRLLPVYRHNDLEPDLRNTDLERSITMIASRPSAKPGADPIFIIVGPIPEMTMRVLGKGFVQHENQRLITLFVIPTKEGEYYQLFPSVTVTARELERSLALRLSPLRSILRRQVDENDIDAACPRFNASMIKNKEISRTRLLKNLGYLLATMGMLPLNVTIINDRLTDFRECELPKTIVFRSPSDVMLTNPEVVDSATSGRFVSLIG